MDHILEHIHSYIQSLLKLKNIRNSISTQYKLHFLSNSIEFLFTQGAIQIEFTKHIKYINNYIAQLKDIFFPEEYTVNTIFFLNMTGTSRKQIRHELFRKHFYNKLNTGSSFTLYYRGFYILGCYKELCYLTTFTKIFLNIEYYFFFL